MYASCSRCSSSLGEVLPAGVLYSTQDAPAAGLVAMVTKDWSLFQSGAEAGGNFDQFQEAVRFGWVDNTPAGYDRFMGYMVNGAADPANLNAIPEFLAWSTAWTWAYALAHGGANWTVDQAPALWLNQVQSWIGRGMTQAAAQVADAAFQKYFPAYLVKFGGPAAPPLTSATAVVTNPVTGVKTPLDQVQYFGPNPLAWDTETLFQLKTGQLWGSAGKFTGSVIGSPAGNGSVTVGDMVFQLPQSFIDSYANKAAAEAAAHPPTIISRTFDAVLIHPTVDPARYFNVTDPSLYSPKFQRVHEKLSDGTATTSPWQRMGAGGWAPLDQWRTAAPWGTDGYGPLWPDRVTLQLWESLSSSDQAAILAEANAGPQPAEPVPYIPGSHVFVPAPGTGGETTIQLPGSSTPIPVSQLPPQYQAPTTAAPTTPAAAPGSQPAATTPAAGAPPSQYALPGGGYPGPSSPAGSANAESEPAPAPQAAGIGSGLLIAGGILAAVVLGSRKGRGRVRGYRRF